MMLMNRMLASAGVLALSTGFAAASPAVVQSAVNLRSGPGTDYGVIAAMPGGAAVDVTGCGDDWCRVDFDGMLGFASRRYLDLGGVAVGPIFGGWFGGYAPGYTYGYYGTPAYRTYYEREREFRGQPRVRTSAREERGQARTAPQIGGNNPMKDAKRTANPNLRRPEGQAAEIRGNNPMKDSKGTAATGASTTTGAAPREGQ